jgi:uncharacterized membrane protein
MNSKEQSSNFILSVNRLEAISDGIIAIAATILVLLLETPKQMVTETELLNILYDELHTFLAFILSFILISLYWWNHHLIISKIKAVDNPLALFNLLFLLFIAFIPFPTHLLIEFFDTDAVEIAILIYSITNILTSLCLYLLWKYAKDKGHLLKENIDTKFTKEFYKLMLYQIPLYILAIIVSFINHMLVFGIFSLVIILNIYLAVKMSIKFRDIQTD